MAKVRMPEKTAERYEKISQGLADAGFKKGKDFSIFNALGKWQILCSPEMLEKILLMDALLEITKDKNG